jgi:hypothetical protein
MSDLTPFYSIAFNPIKSNRFLFRNAFPPLFPVERFSKVVVLDSVSLFSLKRLSWDLVVFFGKKIDWLTKVIALAICVERKNAWISWHYFVIGHTYTVIPV